MYIVAALHVWSVTRFVQGIPPSPDWLDSGIESRPASGLFARQFIPERGARTEELAPLHPPTFDF
jgi:hypothetical protein